MDQLDRTASTLLGARVDRPVISDHYEYPLGQPTVVVRAGAPWRAAMEADALVAATVAFPDLVDALREARESLALAEEEAASERQTVNAARSRVETLIERVGAAVEMCERLEPLPELQTTFATTLDGVMEVLLLLDHALS